MKQYQHSQVGYFTSVLFTIVTAAMVYLALTTPVAWFFWLLAAVFGASVLTFGMLTVTISNGQISAKFGVSPIRKKFAIKEIKEAKTVKNPWYYGWGIRYYGQGWLYNVSGFDAVELTMENDQKYRIGTDEPKKLLAAIKAAQK